MTSEIYNYSQHRQTLASVEGKHLDQRSDEALGNHHEGAGMSLILRPS